MIPELPSELQKKDHREALLIGMFTTLAALLGLAATLIGVQISSSQATKADLEGFDRERRDAAYLSYVTAADAYQDYKHQQLLVDECMAKQFSETGQYGETAEEAALYEQFELARNRVEFVVGADNWEKFDKLNVATQAYDGFDVIAAPRGQPPPKESLCRVGIGKEKEMLAAYDQSRKDFVNAARVEISRMTPLTWSED